MHVYSFKNDYSEGCHPAILEKLLSTNLSQQYGYGTDEYSNQARDCIRQKIQNPQADIHFVSGGTQANLILIGAALRPHQSVISANTGHIHVHEAGSIEATGHKINVVQSTNGKLTVEDIQAVLDEHSNDPPHMVKPKMVYISNTTEVGTIYKKAELQKIYELCQSNNLYLFLDGARLGSALSASDNDLTLADLGQLTDAFYIGGTKNGALLGEAIVINNDQIKEDFGYHLKQRGALMAKGRALGIQFLELFKEDLFFQLAKHANAMASKISNAFQQKGYSFLTNSTSNQVFPILPNEFIEKLSEKYGFYVWAKINDHESAIRLVTSWATDEKMVDQFIQDLG